MKRISSRVLARAVRLLAWMALVLLGLVSGQTPSAPQRARLLGAVKDDTGVAVPDAAVRLQDAAGHTVSAHTNPAGEFLLSALAPGSASITIEKHGFFQFRQDRLQLRPGDNHLEFRLPHVREIQQQVEVVSSANPIQPLRGARSETLVAQEVRDLPFSDSHDINKALAALPAIVADNQGQLHVAGSRTGEAEYLLNGFEIGDPANGTFSSRLDIDSVRAANVQTGIYGAEYAHAGAGVLDLTTETGNDRFHFGTTNFIPGVVFNQGVHFGNWYPRVNLSGPIRRGRAWFADGLSLQHSFSLVTELPRGQNTQTQWRGDNLFSAQFNLSPRNSLFSDFLFNGNSQTNYGLNPFAPLETTTNINSHRGFVSLRDQISFGNDILNLGAGWDSGSSDQTPKGDALYVIQPQTVSGNYFQTLHQSSRRAQAVGDLLLPSLKAWGTHDLSLGFNADWIRFSQNATRNPYVVESAQQVLLQRAAFTGDAALAVPDRQAGLYVQDGWQIGRHLRLLPGFRVDSENLTTNAVAEPRLAANIFPFKDDRAKLTVGWGVYFQPVNLTLYGQGLDQQRLDTFYDPAGNPLGPPVTTSFVLPAAGIRSMYFDTTSLGWQQRIQQHTWASIYFLRRIEHNGLAYQPTGNNPLGGAFLLENGRQDRYKSLEIALRHSFEERAELFADYTRSKADTNQALDYSLISPIFGQQAPGPLSWDAPNRFLSWGWTRSPFWDLLLSYNADYRTGYPFNVVNQQQQLVGTPNSMRFPTYFRFDLGFEKQFRFHAHLWGLRLAIINVLGRNNPTVVVNNIDAPNYLTFSGSQGRAFTFRLRLIGHK